MSDHLYPVVILAGGLARRLGPLSRDIPKALMDVNGEPFLAHQLRLLKANGASQVVLCVGHLGDQIEAALGGGRSFGLKIDYSYDGPTPLGTGGAVQQALPKVPGLAFFVLYGDSYLECDYAAIQSAFDTQGKPALMTVFRNESRWDASNVEFSAGRIHAYDKVARTDRMAHIDYGLGILRKEAFSQSGAVFDLAELYQALLRANQLAACEVSQRFYEIGSPAGLEETRRHLAGRKRRAVFLDRDGVLIASALREGKPYAPSRLDQVEILPGIPEAVRSLSAAGFLLIGATNQPDVARGSIRREVVEEINARLLAVLPLTEIRVCYEADDGCRCRKPNPGMLLDAAEQHGIDLAGSFMVGDRWKDVEAGRRAGCRTVFLHCNYDEPLPDPPADFTASSLLEAAEWILANAPVR